MYDSLMKAGKWTAAQNKTEENELIDSIGELVAICETQGFIPKFYVESPNDKVDRVIQDMQIYTKELVTNELGLGNMIENALKAIQEEKEQIDEARAYGEAVESKNEEDELFDYSHTELDDEDFDEFYDFQDELTDEDLLEFNSQEE